jgi:hypothetical protein
VSCGGPLRATSGSGRPTKRLSHEATGTVDVHDFTVYERDRHQHKDNPRDFLRRTDALARQSARNFEFKTISPRHFANATYPTCRRNRPSIFDTPAFWGKHFGGVHARPPCLIQRRVQRGMLRLTCRLVYRVSCALGAKITEQVDFERNCSPEKRASPTLLTLQKRTAAQRKPVVYAPYRDQRVHTVASPGY